MKYCSKCGNANTDEAVFCAGCGSPLEQAPTVAQSAPAPEPVTYTAPAPQQPVYTAPAYDSSAYSAPAAPAGEVKNKATLWLILNIVITVLCCPFSFIFSVIGIIMAGMGMSSFNKGDYDDMNKKSKLSMIMFIIGLAVGLLATIIVTVLVITNAISMNDFFSGYNWYN